jgi:hypothetical protein
MAEMAISGAPDHIHQIGESVQSTWLELAASTGLTMTVGGLPALASFSLTERDPLTIKTYVTSRMLDQGYLAGPNLYASIAHTPVILEGYFTALTPVFEEIAQCDDQELLARLPDGLAQSGFKRLT